MTARETDANTVIEQIAEIFTRQGAEAYLGEPVTMAEHMLQAAALAQAEGAPEPLVAAALLHDIGHFTGALGAYSPDDVIDRQHDRAGAQMLRGVFPAVVAECVGLHVAAKRFLCATDATYHARLSEASRHTLSLQGGPMTDAEVEAFRRQTHHQDAVRVRLWDEGAKVAGAATPSFEAFRPLLARVLASRA